tara:strand:- start:1382 stop:1585 length:204 start_codon:yes stop_codon:yes gene_type:complete
LESPGTTKKGVVGNSEKILSALLVTSKETKKLREVCDFDRHVYRSGNWKAFDSTRKGVKKGTPTIAA